MYADSDDGRWKARPRELTLPSPRRFDRADDAHSPDSGARSFRRFDYSYLTYLTWRFSVATFDP